MNNALDSTGFPFEWCHPSQKYEKKVFNILFSVWIRNESGIVFFWYFWQQRFWFYLNDEKTSFSLPCLPCISACFSVYLLHGESNLVATWTKAHDFLQRGSGVRSPVCPKFQIVAANSLSGQPYVRFDRGGSQPQHDRGMAAWQVLGGPSGCFLSLLPDSERA